MKKLLPLIIILGILMIFVSFKGTFALFTDSAQSTNNTFAAAAVFPTAIPSATPSPTPVPIATTLDINEILPHSDCKSGNTENQYVELWNGSGEAVDLQQFKLTDGTNTIAIASANISLPSGSFAILLKDTGLINSCLNKTINNAVQVNLGGNIDLNTGTLELLDSNNAVIDTVKWGTGSGLLHPAINQSIERVPTGHDSATGTSFTSSDFIIKETYTPGYGTSLVLNEFLYDASAGNHEWEEIYNSGNTSISLTGWKITDTASNSASFTGTISSLGFATIDNSSSFLNNGSADTVFLKDNLGKIIDSHTYTGTNQVDQTIGRQTDANTMWKQPCTATSKGLSNNGHC